jgi:CRISP-associated protein Cas1
MLHIVDIAEHGRALGIDRGFLIVRSKGEIVAQVALDDVGAVLITGRGASWSSDLALALAERGTPMAICGAQYLPVAWMLPVVGHHAQTRIMAAQADASKTLNRRLWQRIVRAKLRSQAGVLEKAGKERGLLDGLVGQVELGDATNVEATGAARYWPALFGKAFRRDRAQGGLNALLNYGYTVLRACVARAAVAAGLHPSVAIRHRRDPLALADDLIEPFRGAIDACVVTLAAEGKTDISLSARLRLVDVLGRTTTEGTIGTSIGAFTRWVADAYVNGRMAPWRTIDVAAGALRPANRNARGTEDGGNLQEGPPHAGLREDAVVGVHAPPRDGGYDGHDRA